MRAKRTFVVTVKAFGHIQTKRYVAQTPLLAQDAALVDIGYSIKVKEVK